MKKEIKKLFVGALILVASLSLTSFSSNENPSTPKSNKGNEKEVAAPTDCHHGQCNAIAKSTGKRCLHCVSNAGDLYCYQHK